MKHKLLTSTAVGALLATSGYVYAEGIGLRFFGGINWLGKQSHEGLILTNTLYTIDDNGYTTRSGFVGDFDMDNETGYVFGGAVNYQWDNGLILELEAAYRRNRLDDFGGSGFRGGTYLSTGSSGSFLTSTGTRLVVEGDGHVSAVSLMANAWYEFNLGNSQWKPYIGGGVGIAWLDMHGLIDATSTFSTGKGPLTKTSTNVIGFHGTESGFAWQLGAGVGYEFAPGKQITFDYRYFNGPTLDNVQFGEVENDVDYDYSAHNLMLGIKLGL